MNLDEFNGLWVVRESNYVTDPDPESHHRSIAYLNGSILEGTQIDKYEWYVPLFSNRTEAEKAKTEICEKLHLDQNNFGVYPIISLRDVRSMLEGFLRLGRLQVCLDPQKNNLVAIRELLKDVVNRLG